MTKKIINKLNIFLFKIFFNQQKREDATSSGSYIEWSKAANVWIFYPMFNFFSQCLILYGIAYAICMGKIEHKKRLNVFRHVL